MALNQLKAGAALSYVSIILNNIIGLTYTPFMLRMMGQNEYGLFSLVSSVVAYLTVLDLGFANAIVRYTAKFRAEKKIKEQYEMFGMFFILYCVIGIVAFIIGLGLYFNVDELFGQTMKVEDLDKVRIMMLLLVFNIAFTFPMSIWGAIITAYEDFVFQKVVNLFRIILNPLIMIVLLMIGYRAVAMVVVITLFNVVTLCINAWYCFRHINIKVRFSRFRWGFLREVAIYSFWIFLNTIMDKIYWSTGQFILGMFVGAVAVAVYAIAIQLENIYMSFSTAISGVFLPKVTAMVATHKSEKDISDLFVRTGRIQYVILAFILSGFILFGRQFVMLWAGADYEDAYIIALMFFVPLTVPLIQNMGITILQAKNQMKFRSVLYVIIALLSLGISIPLSKVYGGIGCAVGTTVALVAGQIVAMNVYYYKKVSIDIPHFWREIGKMSIVPFVVCTIGFFIMKSFPCDTILTLVIGIVTFSVIYIPLFWCFSLNSYERDLVKAPIIKFTRRFKLW